MDNYNEELGLNIPEHVAIILDGNGRWAKKRFLPRNVGHAQGSKVLEQITDDAVSIGIKYLTVYVFSTENWKRPKAEVAGLMTILRNYLKTCIQKANKDNYKVRIIGTENGLDEDIIESINRLQEATKNNTGLVFQIALNYGSRNEIVRAVKRITEDAVSGKITSEDIDETLISSYLDTAGIPDPDLIIRTSGEKRISNYLLWQGAYSELDFPEVLWPDFNKESLIDEIRKYNNRDRRFGGVKEE